MCGFSPCMCFYLPFGPNSLLGGIFNVLCLFSTEVIPEEVKEVKLLNVSGNFPEAITLDAANGVLLEEGRIELAKTQRQNQIMQGFAKALWNVLKQYKHKLLVIIDAYNWA